VTAWDCLHHVTIKRSLLGFKIITMFKITALAAILFQIQIGAFVYIGPRLGFKIITSFKIAALDAILPQIKNGCGVKLSGSLFTSRKNKKFSY